MRSLPLLLLVIVTSAWAQERLPFVGVALDVETRQADRKLRDYLAQQTGIAWARQEMDYERVIRRLMSTDEGPYVARVTPYVYVVAEMLGARMEPLATYVSSATNTRTYHAYLVVRKADFPSPPTLFDIAEYLRAGAAKNEPRRFVFHSRFSTSSYFVPSFYFRSNNLYHMQESTESLAALATDWLQENSSARLVEQVAQRRADLAAVWDGTRKRFLAGESAHEEVGQQVHFVQLPTAMPNDLLVCADALDTKVKERLRAALRKMAPDEITIGDFRTWHSLRDALDARQALADLRWLARQRPRAATIEISLHPGARATPATLRMVEAAREAVRLAGSELTLFDDDYHVHIDYTWMLEPIHDGAVLLRSRLNGAGIEDQEFRMSFRDPADLTRRIVALAQGRMHRIRYVWAYSSTPPTIIRDIALSIPEGTPVKVQRINWLDPERNKFLAGPIFTARIREGSSYRYGLDADDFWRAGESVTSFDPLSNVSYRVYLTRPVEQRVLFVGITYALVALLACGAVAAVVSSLRRA